MEKSYIQAKIDQMTSFGKDMLLGGYLNFKFADEGLKKYEEQFIYLDRVFSAILAKKAVEYMEFCPYEVTVHALVEKNRYTRGTYVALNNEDGTLDLFLSPVKLAEMEEFPYATLSWVLFHEFRHKIQLNDEVLKSLINYPNFANLNKFMQEEFGKSEDVINHLLHEVNPAEVDANVFACEMTEMKFVGNAFDIDNESLKKLKK